MALLGTYIDVRTLATIATQGSSTFAHGLGAAPDFVFAQFEAAATRVEVTHQSLPEPSVLLSSAGTRWHRRPAGSAT